MVNVSGPPLVEQILHDITAAYLSSNDFNGLPVMQLLSRHGLDETQLRDTLRSLVETDAMALVFGDIHPNPHVRALPDEPKEAQLMKLESSLSVYTCGYPTKGRLAKVVDSSDYAGRPYTLSLALGEPHLDLKAFDLSVLEFYRNDPRYSYTTNDISGYISTHHDAEQPGSHLERDQIYLQRFGFCYDDDLNRAVAVPIRYLANLTPEHQQMWKTRELSGNYTPHPDYDRQRRGLWGESISIFDAFIAELELVNRMCSLMSRPPLFTHTFEQDRPRGFAFLIRPTLDEFNDFVLTLDKMMSENIDKRFFSGEVSDQEEYERGDGKVEIRPRGTITMLEEWLRTHFDTPDRKPLEEMIASFREVRQMRQKPAHGVNPNTFDQKYFHEQRALIIRAYSAVRALRLTFANWPEVRSADLQIDEALYKGKIWRI